MSSPGVRNRNTLKRDSMRFVAALVAVLASSVAGPNAAQAAPHQHHDQVPGFYRLKVGDLEVTALYATGQVGTIGIAGGGHWQLLCRRIWLRSNCLYESR
jgi:hypothetical protein